MGLRTSVVTPRRSCADTNAMAGNRRARAAYKRQRQEAAKMGNPYERLAS